MTAGLEGHRRARLRKPQPPASNPKRWLKCRRLASYPALPACNRFRQVISPKCPSVRSARALATVLSFAVDRSPRSIRIVLVNNRVPRTDQHCALCGEILEKGYLRDSRTRLIYCDTLCFAGWTYETAPVVRNRGRKAS